ncbi:hypothetical protein FPV67DRAFT_1668123 [Lyophyllum atratum]|nr:hypothetical protein FPV67DRAFT_1668123 [Lyophyllum atratum]
MTGLRKGFWPFDKWEIELKDFIGNYSINDRDLDAIRAFRDKECGAGRWSDALPDTELLPGMKMSPMLLLSTAAFTLSAVWSSATVPHLVVGVLFLASFGSVLGSSIGLWVYMDDFFCWDFEGNCVWFHRKLHPRRQVQLLLLWDAIGCPWEDKKQEHGDVLKIIGFWVYANHGTLSLAPDTIIDILDRIQDFLSIKKWHPTLRDWQSLGGHLNWLLNVLPWGCPALTELYRKMNEKSLPSHGIPINAAVVTDLTWLKTVIPDAIGVHFIDDGVWRVDEADMVIWSDASLKTGLGFVYSNQGFCYALEPCPPRIRIDIFLELVAILSAIHHVASLPSPPRRLLTDSLNFVFNSLRTNIDIRVCHIPGKENVRADLLSHLMLDEYHRKFPADRVRLFTPPRELLPARWRLPLDPTPQTLSRYIAFTSQFIASGPKRKLPLRPAHLSTFLLIARQSGSYDLLFAAILSVCFYACHRSGELIQKNGKDLFDWAEGHKTGFAGCGGPRGPRYVIVYMVVAQLFSCAGMVHIPPGLGLMPSPLRFFAGILAAIPPVQLGLSEDIIQAIGRWSSAAWKIYVRENPSIRAELQLAALRLRFRY